MQRRFSELGLQDTRSSSGVGGLRYGNLRVSQLSTHAKSVTFVLSCGHHFEVSGLFSGTERKLKHGDRTAPTSCSFLTNQHSSPLQCHSALSPRSHSSWGPLVTVLQRFGSTPPSGGRKALANSALQVSPNNGRLLLLHVYL